MGGPLRSAQAGFTMIRLSQLIAALVLALLGSAGLSLPALAHAQLLSSDPVAQSVLAGVPEKAVLEFNEPVSPVVLSLIGPDGTRRDLRGTATGDALSIALPAGLDRGTHVLSWRVVSVDAHPVAGSLVFSIGQVSGQTGEAMSSGSPATASILWVSKLVLYVALAVGVGGAIFALVAPLDMRLRRSLSAASLLGFLPLALSLLAQGADLLGLGPETIFTADAGRAGASTSSGLTVLLLAAALAMASIALSVRRLALFALVGALLVGIGLAVSGHAGAAAPQWLTRTAIVVHILCLLFWVGALVPLASALARPGEQGDRMLGLFSRVIVFPVGLLMLSGLVLAGVQMGWPGPAWFSPYGGLLAAKLIVVALLFALALVNRLRLTAPSLAGDTGARRLLRRSIVVELGLVLLVLGLVAGWRFTPPPRALAEVAAAEAALAVPLYAHAMNAQVMADITIAPGHAGPVRLFILLMDAAGAPLAAEGVTVELASPAHDISGLSAPATLVDGLWQVQDLVIPLGGTWEITLDVRLDRFTLARIASEFVIP